MKLTARPGFEKLVKNIAGLFEGVRRNLAAAYWQTGRWIVEAEQKGEPRAKHGDRLLTDLSAKLTERMGSGFSKSNLVDMRKYYLIHRNARPAVHLPVSHQIEIARVLDDKRRKELEKRAEEEGLSREELRRLIRIEKNKTGSSRPADRTPLVPRLGIPGTYRVKGAGEIGWPAPSAKNSGTDPFSGGEAPAGKPAWGVLFLDNGFRSYKALTSAEARGLKAGDIVEASGTGSFFSLKKSKRTEKDLYTYPAYFTKGIDGDTFWMTLDRGRGDVSLQKLRLREIDCPEIKTPNGQTAKKFVESALKAAVSITVCSSKNDKYDRYEADVFFEDKTGKQVYLNNLLLEKGHAVRVRS